MTAQRDERFTIEGDPEDALRGLLRGAGEPMCAEDMARKHGVDGLALRNLIRANHDDLAPTHGWHEPYEITPEVEAKIISLPEFHGLPKL
jgi:hypothetical protein